MKPLQLAGILLLLAAGRLPAQDIGTAVLPQDITVGDVFQVVVRVTGAGTTAVVFPDSLQLPPDLESAGARQVRTDTTTAGPRWTAVYPVTAWRPGSHQLAAAPVVVRAAGADRTATASFPAVLIRSVLPADTAGVQPRPPKDVLGGNRVWWPWLLLAAALAAVAAALLWWRRQHHRAEPVVPLPLLPPREVAIEALERARRSGALEAGDFKRFYTDVSGALRGYLAALDPVLGTDLTTSEVLHALRPRSRTVRLPELRTALEAADLVKFARRHPDLPTAEREWQQARDWVLSVDPVPALESAA